MTAQMTFTAVLIADASMVHHGTYPSAQKRCDDVMEILRSNYELPELEDYSDSTEPDDILHDTAQELLDDGLDLHLIEEEADLPAIASPIHSLIITAGANITAYHARSAEEVADHLLHRIAEYGQVLTQHPGHIPQAIEIQSLAIFLREFVDGIDQVTYAVADTPVKNTLTGTISDHHTTGH